MKYLICCVLLFTLIMEWSNVMKVSGKETEQGTDNHCSKIDEKGSEVGDENSQNGKLSSHFTHKSCETEEENDEISSEHQSGRSNVEINLLSEAENLHENDLNKRIKLHKNDEDLAEIKSALLKTRRSNETFHVEQDTQHTQEMKGTQKNTIAKGEEGSESIYVTYVGAVLEYEPYNEWYDEEKGYGILRKNAKRIVSFASEAKKQSADILIAPEYGLQSLSMNKCSTEKFLTYTQYVPDPSDKIIPCHFSHDADHFEAIQILSCGARDNEIYLVVCLAELYPCSEETVSNVPWEIYPSEDCPEKGFFAYNTQVVFDRKGTVIARYRKQNLYEGEIHFTPGPLDDTTAIFVTDFNVAFSLQICYDVVHEHPGYSNIKNYGIRDVAMSTAWVDELPFTLADAIQSGWSQGLGINLLVSGFHYPDFYCLGSGIYRSFFKDIPVYTYDKNSGNVLLVAPVTTIAASNLISNRDKYGKTPSFNVQERHHQGSVPSILNLNNNEEDRKQVIFHNNLSEFTRVLLERGKPGEIFNISVCSNDNFCCDLRYEYSGNLTYFFMVFSGTSLVIHGKKNLGVQQCGVVWCKTVDYKTCAHVELGLPEADSFGPFKISSSSFSSDFVYPIENQRNLSLINKGNLDFEVSSNYFSISASEPVENPLTAALCGRWFGKDE